MKTSACYGWQARVVETTSAGYFARWHKWERGTVPRARTIVTVAPNQLSAISSFKPTASDDRITTSAKHWNLPSTNIRGEAMLHHQKLDESLSKRPHFMCLVVGARFAAPTRRVPAAWQPTVNQSSATYPWACTNQQAELCPQEPALAATPLVHMRIAARACD